MGREGEKGLGENEGRIRGMQRAEEGRGGLV